MKEEISKKDQEILSLESQLKEAEKLLVSLNKRYHDDLKMISRPYRALESLFMCFVCFVFIFCFCFIHVRYHKM